MLYYTHNHLLTLGKDAMKFIYISAECVLNITKQFFKMRRHSRAWGHLLCSRQSQIGASNLRITSNNLLFCDSFSYGLFKNRVVVKITSVITVIRSYQRNT